MSKLRLCAALLCVAAAMGCSRKEATRRAAHSDGGPPRSSAVVSSSQLRPADLRYQGAFRLPSDFDWGARGMTYSPEGGGSLLVLGPDPDKAQFARVAIPPAAKGRTWAALPMAKMATGLRDFGRSVVTGVDSETAFASGIELVPRRGSQQTDKLYGSLDNWYGVADASHNTVWMSEADGSRPRGPFHVGPRKAPFHGNKSGDYLFSVPQWYADQYLSGRTLISGKTRGAFFGSQGPTLLAFRPWDGEEPSGELEATALLWYRIKPQACAGPNVGDKGKCDFPNFTMCDKWEGGGFVEQGSRRAILLAGTKGLGPNRYGDRPNDKSCLSDRGYHCDPFERQVIFYDVDELGQVATGKREPWTVVPYAVWRPKELLLQGQTCGEMGALAVDSRGKRMFLIEKGLDENNSAVVHIWQF